MLKFFRKLLSRFFKSSPSPQVETSQKKSQLKNGLDFWEHEVKWFHPREFDSPDAPGTGLNMDYSLIRKLDQMRELLKFPIRITSGFRTKNYNKSLRERGYKSVRDSSHLKGLAVDIYAQNPFVTWQIVDAAMGQKIGRIFVSTTLRYIHCDIDEEKTQGLWGK